MKFHPPKVGENSEVVFAIFFKKWIKNVIFTHIWWVKTKFHPPKVGENSAVVFADANYTVSSAVDLMGDPKKFQSEQ